MATTQVVRPYEGVILVNPEASEEVQKALFQKNAKIIKDHSGEVNSVETWGKRYLGNPIDKITKATYFHTTFTANNDAVAELERTMRINDNVLRFMHIKLEEGTDLKKYLEGFKDTLAETLKKVKEIESKQQKKAERFAEAKRSRKEG